MTAAGGALRWGILSTARIALDAVGPAIRDSAGGRVVAVASRDGGRARRAAALLGAPKAYASYAALIDDPDVEAIYNPLPNHLHHRWTLKALEAGKHVLCEKPVALDAAQALQLADAARRTRRIAAEAFMIRHHPQWRAARDLLRDGRIGRPSLMQVAFSFNLTNPADFRNQHAAGGGALYDIGCYGVAAGRFLFADEPSRVMALTDIDEASGVDRLTLATLDFPGRRAVQFSCAIRLAPAQHVMIFGEAGRLTIDIPFNPPADRRTVLRVDDGRDHVGSGAEVIELPPSNAYRIQADAFADAVRGRAPLEWDMADAVGNMRVLDALFRSGRSGMWEPVR